MTQKTQTSGEFPVRVLIVDDHPNTATTLARAVSQMGSKVDVISATSGREALEKVQSGAADIIITDMIMPEMNGLELVEKLQNHPGGRPSHIFLITAYDVPGLKETARRLKVDEIIAKPVRPERICQIVSQILEQWSQSRQPDKVEKAFEKSFKILIADNRPDNVTLLARYFANDVYNYITATGGLETVDKVRAELPDLIVTDLMMPGIDGFGLVEELKLDPRNRDIPVVVVSAKDISPDERKRLNGHIEVLYQKGSLSTRKFVDQVIQAIADRCGEQGELELGHNILYVEDNPDNMLLVQRALEARGYKLLQAQNGTEGIALAENEDVDLILLDINLPDIDGYEVAQRIRNSAKNKLAYTPIIAITANALAGDAEKALTAGCDVYMSKPINIRELWARVEAFVPAPR